MKEDEFNKNLEKVLELIYKIEIQAKKDLQKDRREYVQKEYREDLYSYKIQTEYRY